MASTRHVISEAALLEKRSYFFQLLGCRYYIIIFFCKSGVEERKMQYWQMSKRAGAFSLQWYDFQIYRLRLWPSGAGCRREDLLCPWQQLPPYHHPFQRPFPCPAVKDGKDQSPLRKRAFRNELLSEQLIRSSLSSPHRSVASLGEMETSSELSGNTLSCCISQALIS